jgi:hypothetical protein
MFILLFLPLIYDNFHVLMEIAIIIFIIITQQIGTGDNASVLQSARIKITSRPGPLLC